MNAPTPDNTVKSETRMLRYMSDCLALPALCRNATCRRMKQCKGQPRDCLSRFAPLVPEDAREWVKAMLEGLDDRRDFDDVREDYPDEFAAFIAWREALANARIS